MKLYGISNCDTVKKARDFLQTHKIDFEFFDFKKNPPQVEDIERWIKVFGDLPVNKMGTTYKKHKNVFENLNHSQQIDFIRENTSMIKRPILEKNNGVIVFGFLEKEYKNG